MSKILVIDDEITIIQNIKFVLELEYFEVLTSSCSVEALEIFKENHETIDVVITDMRMPKLSGMDVLREIKNISPYMSVVVLTGHGDLENAILAMKEGAFEYITKPVNADKLSIVINKAIMQKTLLLENALMQKEIIEQNDYLEGLNKSAERILLNMLPQDTPTLDGFKFAINYNSCDNVGGDMYDISDIGKYLCFFVFDVSSHGILAAVVATILNSFLQNIEYNYKQGINKRRFPEIVSDLNNILVSNTEQNVFATLFLGFINKQTNVFYYVSAGHPTQYVITSHEIIPLPSTGVILGVFDNVIYNCTVTPLSTGDKILVFTDGITEAGFDDEIFGTEKLEILLNENKDAPIETIVELVISEAKKYANGIFYDDVTVVGIEVK